MKLNTGSFVALLFVIIAIGYTSYKLHKSRSQAWNIEMERLHLTDRENMEKWNDEMFRQDLLHFTYNELPFTSGVFPTPEYDLVGRNSFKGVGNYGFPGGPDAEFKLGGKKILFNSFYVGTNIFNHAFLDESVTDEVFFHIIVLTDSVDTVNYTHLQSEIVSRNHPDYIGQGYYITRNSRIDYTAFITASRNEYAIINMRLFNLKEGRTILIAPFKDHSFRSMQIKSPALSSKNVAGFTDSLLKKHDIFKFFTSPGSI